MNEAPRVAKEWSWSYSQLTRFEQCARKWAWTYEWKNKEPDTKEQQEGRRQHKAMEARAKGTPLPPDLVAYEKFGVAVDTARKAGLAVVAEMQLAINRNFQPTEWFAKNVWMRGVIDLAIMSADKANIWDWKTGKPKDDPTQLDIFAAVFFLHYSHIEQVGVSNVWLKGLTADTPVRYGRQDMLRVWSEVLPRVERMERQIIRMRAEGFEESPGPLCGWCPDTKCTHNTMLARLAKGK